MNHQIFGFPAVITPAPQVPANLTQWQAPVPSAESNSDHMRCESVSPPGASTSVLVSQQSFNESVVRIVFSLCVKGEPKIDKKFYRVMREEKPNVRESLRNVPCKNNYQRKNGIKKTLI